MFLRHLSIHCHRFHCISRQSWLDEWKTCHQNTLYFHSLYSTLVKKKINRRIKISYYTNSQLIFRFFLETVCLIFFFFALLSYLTQIVKTGIDRSAAKRPTTSGACHKTSEMNVKGMSRVHVGVAV